MIDVPTLLLNSALVLCVSSDNGVRSMPRPNWNEILVLHKELRNVEDLKWLLTEAFRSYESCEFPRQLLDRVTFGGNSSETVATTLECLGRLEYRGISIDTRHPIVSIEVQTEELKAAGPESYVLLFVFSGNHWLMYPAAPADLRIYQGAEE